MHYLKLIIVKADDSSEAMWKVEDWMDGICEAGRYADWYSIGGMWAGYFDGKTTAPLSDVLSTVQERVQENIEELDIEKARALEYLSGNNEKYYPYRLSELADWLCGNFCNAAVVFNHDRRDWDKAINNIPEDPSGYWVVVVDNHN